MNDKPVKPSNPAGVPNQLICDIRQMIEEARAAVAIRRKDCLGADETIRRKCRITDTTFGETAE